jgi:aspartyl-tRNA(Asn)/glutamyl-tRNA(Gln) amidotransferase subunit C
MSKIGIDEVKRIAALAKIGLSEAEVSAMATELGRIVEFVEQLQAVKTAGVPPTNQVTGLVDVWREDSVEPYPASQDELLRNAPQRQGGYIKVRRVLE